MLSTRTRSAPAPRVSFVAAVDRPLFFSLVEPTAGECRAGVMVAQLAVAVLADREQRDRVPGQVPRALLAVPVGGNAQCAPRNANLAGVAGVLVAVVVGSRRLAVGL